MATFEMSVEVPVEKLARDLGLRIVDKHSLYLGSHYITSIGAFPSFPERRLFAIGDSKLPRSIFDKLGEIRYIKRIDNPIQGGENA